mgnify:CR=1 FL=1
MGNNIILETKFVADIRGSFYIPSYQRGYRWSETEVVRLLDDIYQNGKKNYCLQPVVVRKKEDQYELIDGQQRLTTLYLIYKYMKNVNPFFNEPAFTLSYQTRDQSEEFLKTLDMTKQDDNIDFWFISKAYNTIKEWFEQDLQIRVMHIFEYLKEDVKIIWYEVGESEDAISLFTRLNIGKIPLTSAELVKAMFLSRDNAENMRREKQEEISLQWDGIERELHNESLWFFLTNSVKGEYQTRIDLVLDLIAGKEESTREKYYTFFRFDELRKKVSLDDIWKKIYQTFLTLKGWYEDHDLYHRIGYLITSGTSLHKIFALSKDKKKSEFNESLDELIKKSVAISGNYAELSYEKPLDYKRISTLLLLFNIESVRRSDGHAQRFPFDQFKHHKGSNVTWSLEHIHAQQSEGIEINFNVNQIQEEKEKIEFLMQNPDRTDEVFELEDHNMLKGQIGIIGLDNLSLGSRFSSLFTCSWDKIDCALMALGNYGQQERNKWRYQFASKSLQYAWDELFHKSANAGFENTHTILVELLKSKESFDDGILDRIISAFLAQCEKDNLYPWNYYYVKYPVFRPGSYGKMSNDDVVNKPYMFSVMQTKTQWSQNTYMPYLKEADDDHLSRDEMGQYLVYDDVYIVCENNSYGVYRNDDDSLTDTVTISQNEAGIDTEDRIIKLKKYIANMK